MKNWQRILKLFEACNSAKSLTQLHSIIIKTGLNHDAFYAAKLNHLYCKHTTLERARKLFDETPERSTYSWNAILKLHCSEKQYEETLHLFTNMLQTSEKPDHFTFPIALKACIGLKAVKGRPSLQSSLYAGELKKEKLDYGEIIHGYVKKNGEIDSNLFVGSVLIEFYSKCGKMDDALRVFEEYSEPDVVLWSTLLTAYEQNGEPEKALEFFARMMREVDVMIDSITLVSVVSACAQVLNLNAGRSVHGFVIRKGLGGSLSLLNALLNLYAKSGAVKPAANLFRTMEERDVISWGSLISCYAHNGAANEALSLFNEMSMERVKPNSVIFISALQACEATGNLEEGKRIHKLAAQKGLELDVLVSTALIDMYMSCSSPDEAFELFDRVPLKDAVSWSAFLCGCVQNGMAYKSMGVFRNMIASEVQPDAVAMLKILTACSELGILQQAGCLHGYVVRGGFDSNAFVRASLVESYSKCGSLDDAVKLFERTEDRDIVIWSAMFAGYGIHGRGRESLELFRSMIKNAIRPNNVTFLSILAACSHAGLVNEGIEVFNMMVNDYQLMPESKHYGIMVDLLGRTGELAKAMNFIEQMPVPVGAHVWGALLGACRIHQNRELGEVAARNLFRLDPGHAGHYILLSNIYAVEGKWENAAELRTLVKRKEVKKVSGQSVIEFSNGVHSFVANDRYHPDTEQIYQLLRNLEAKMRKEGDITDSQLFAA